MTPDALVARMTEDARSRIAGLQAQADAEIAALERARADAAALDQSKWLAARHSERQRAFAIEHAQARRAAAQRVLAAQYALIDRVFAHAAALATQAEDCVIDALPRLVQAVGRHIGNEGVTLRCRSAFAAALRGCAAALGAVEIVADETIAPGFVAATCDGRCTIDCTLPARLAALRPVVQSTLLECALR